MIKTDVAVIGGGPAGLAAALKAGEGTKVLLLERGGELGGILNQCIHDGFGNFIFNKMLTGPEYAQYYIDRVNKSNIKILTNTTVLNIDHNKNIIATNSKDGIIEIESKSIILAMGCRERTRSQILIPGTRPAGIYTAGTAQRLINIDGYMPGKNIIILGSGDVGLIMARRFTLEGAKVLGVYEIMQNPGGITRNIVQCLEDYNIPLHLSHTVTNIFGEKRIEGVSIAKVDNCFKPIPNTEKYIACDCLILSIGLIPEIELTNNLEIAIDHRTNGIIIDNKMESSIPGIFACGNIVHVYDLVDDVTYSSEIAGLSAVNYCKNEIVERDEIKLISGKNVKYVVPQKIKYTDFENITLYLRVEKEQRDVDITIKDFNNNIYIKKERIVKPAEMLKINLSKKSLESVENKELCIDIRCSNEK
jgi:NADPH-dependent 2,4-dienoyl-CoA reductase/sulfur reductase-like enzyme